MQTAVVAVESFDGVEYISILSPGGFSVFCDAACETGGSDNVV